jgi:hypothetical protein
LRDLLCAKAGHSPNVRSTRQPELLGLKPRSLRAEELRE